MESDQQRVRDIGFQKQVFVDDYVVESTAGVARVVHPG